MKKNQIKTSSNTIISYKRIRYGHSLNSSQLHYDAVTTARSQHAVNSAALARLPGHLLPFHKPPD